MGKHGRKHDKRNKPHSDKDSKYYSTKLLTYSARGKVRKLRSLLADANNDALLSMAVDSSGAGALHQACRYGHLEVVTLLLRHHANPNAVDAAGNTPGHLAAMHKYLVILAELIQRAQPPVDLELPNQAGLTIRDIVHLQEQQKQQGDHSPSSDTNRHQQSSPPGEPSAEENSASDRQDGSNSSSDGSSRGVKRRRTVYTEGDYAEAGNAGVADEAAWNARLAEEMSDCRHDDEGWGSVFKQNWNTAAAAAAAGRHGRRAARAAAVLRSDADVDYDGLYGDAGGDDDDDAWADRLWQDMQDHKRRAAQEAAAAKAKQSSTQQQGFVGDRAAAAEERRRRAAAAAAESERILREEQARDADWRANMMRQIEEAAVPTRRSNYEQKWSALDKWPLHKPITYKDIPWPTNTAAAAAAAASSRTPGPQQHTELHIDPQQLRTLVFWGATGPAALKAALRKELMRWHPDKFGARFGGRLLADDREVILAGVQAVAQQLTALKEA